MMASDIRKLRNTLPYGALRFVFDAFILPVNELPLSQPEEKAFGRLALKAARGIDWETYTTARRTFLAGADEMLRACVGRIPAEEFLGLRRRMYVRFMEGRIRYFEWQEEQEHAQLPAIPVGENDFHNTEMAALFAHMPFQPETADWLKTVPVSWIYDQLHMVTWFSGQLSLGSGKYSRSRPNHSARTTYERLLNPFSLLWIAAALGEDKDLVIKTGLEMQGYLSWRAKCGVVRRAIPWKRICELALPLVEKEREEKKREKLSA